MDWLIPFLTTWGHILVGVGILGMVLLCAHMFIAWVREIRDDNRVIR